MNYNEYIFYDIECANCRNNTAKISNFAYIITDTHFNIIESKEILINPEAPFYSFEIKDGKEIREQYIPQNIDDYLNANNYKNTYDKIKQLFSHNALYIGFGNVSDAYYLFEANSRYSLENFNYQFIDIKDIFENRYKNINKKSYRGLSGLVKFFNIEWEQKHNALDDSMMTLKVCKLLIKKCNNKALFRIAKKYDALYDAIESKVIKKGNIIPKKIYKDMLLPD